MSYYVSPFWQALLIPRQHNVAGVRLMPFSLWHSFYLSQIGNAYWAGGSLSLDAAISMLLVCSENHADGKRTLVDERLTVRKSASIIRTVRRFGLDRLDGEIKTYIKNCTTCPDHAVTSEAASPSRAPHEYHSVLNLTSRYSFTYEAAWDCPYAEAMCLFDTYAETQGDKSLLDAHAIDVIRKNTPGALTGDLIDG